MKNTNTGGPAFPVQSVYIEDQDTNSCGMTLRDYFAAQAMQGLLSTVKDEEWQYDDVAVIAYGMADEMMEARK
jgi:hypothetical protein